MSEFYIANSPELETFCFEHTILTGNIVDSIKGHLPNGEEVNVAWEDRETGEIIEVVWEER